VGLTQRQANRQSDSHTPMESRRLAPPTVFGLQGSLCGFYAGLTALRHAGKHNNASNLAFTVADRPNPGGGASTGSSVAARPCWESTSYVDLRWTQADPNDGNGRLEPGDLLRGSISTILTKGPG
jgi:hypothetical protein